MPVILKILSISLLLVDARVTMLDGNVTEGTFSEIDSDNAILTTDEGASLKHSLKNVVEVSFDSPGDGAPEGLSDLLDIVLVGGTIVRATEIAASSETVTGVSKVFNEITMERDFVRAVRLQALKPEWRAEWSAFLERDNTKDILVVLKRDGSGLDFLPGVVTSIGPVDVPFLLDGDELPAPRARVFGVVFAKQGQAKSALAGDVSLKLFDGSSFQVSSVSVPAQELKSLTSWGQEIVVPLASVSSIDFSGGRLHYLSDLEPISERYFGLDPAGKSWGDLFTQDQATRTGLSRQWKMSRDRFPNSGRPPLSLRGETIAKGLCIFPSAAIEYAVDGKYTRMTALVGVDDEVAFNQQKGIPPTAVELQIKADGREVFKRLVTATENPFPLDLDLKGVTTLTVLVDFGDGSSTCDFLDLANARLLVDTAKE